MGHGEGLAKCTLAKAQGEFSQLQESHHQFLDVVFWGLSSNVSTRPVPHSHTRKCQCALRAMSSRSLSCRSRAHITPEGSSGDVASDVASRAVAVACRARLFYWR